MKLIDGDALVHSIELELDAIGKDLAPEHILGWIEAMRPVDAVPIELLAKRLAGYTMPPGGLKARKVIGKSGIYRFESRVEAWEAWLRGLDCVKKDNDESD